jgi:hypothetical protein
MTTKPETIAMPWNGGHFAHAWLTVAKAAGEEDVLPTLYRTCLIEEYDGRGLCLIATNSWVLATVWVPFGDDDAEAALLEEMPDRSYLVRDVDRRGSKWFAHVGKLAAAAAREAGPVPSITATVRKPRPGSQLGLFDLDDDREVCFELNAGDETVTLPLSPAEFPGWRRLMLDRPGVARQTAARVSFGLAEWTLRCVAAVVSTFTQVHRAVVSLTPDLAVGRFTVEGFAGEPSLAGMFGLDRLDGNTDLSDVADQAAAGGDVEDLLAQHLDAEALADLKTAAAQYAKR